MPTPNLSITTVLASQSQKEVTVNSALYRIDALLNTSVKDKDLATPPVSPTDGDLYIIATGATGAWSGQSGKLAYYASGWQFITPKEGCVLWVADEDLPYIYTGSNWAIKGLIVQSSGEYFRPFRREVTLSALSGASVTAGSLILNREMVLGVHARVTTLVTGATSFSVGISGDTGRFGSGVGVALDSTNIGIATPTPYFADTGVILTAAGGNFTAGSVKLVVHGFQFRGPWSW